MGRAIARLAADAADVELVAGIGRGRDGSLRVEDASGAIAASSVVIDVSAPEALTRLLDVHTDRLAGRALVVGTTGLDAPLEDRLAALAVNTAVLVAANFSLGVNLLAELVRQAASALSADAFDVEIVETHHRGKADAPSGTALLLGRAVAEARRVGLADVRRDGRTGRTGERATGEIGLHALRGGSVPGEHRVHFLGSLERIELAHEALDRDGFAAGALAAARWITGRAPGRYTMADVLRIGRSQ